MCIGPNKKADVTASESHRSNGDVMSSSKPPMNQVDFTQPRREHLFDMPIFMRNWVKETLLRGKDERNLPIFLVGMNILTTSVPWAFSLFYLEHTQSVSTRVLIGLSIAYFACHLKTFARSFMLALHYVTHCSIFSLRFRVLDHIFTSFLSPFFGIPPGIYYPHHIGMHHAMDNVAPLDMSSTMDYERGSKWNHFKYMARFVTVGSFELPYRLFCMKKYSLVAQCATGVAVFWGTMFTLFPQYPIATFFVMYFPWLTVSFGLMQGNFKEHVFVDPDDYENNYKSTVTCINAPSNALTFNTGYHIEHHEEPGLPWFKLPELFLKNISKHAENDSLVFSGIGSMEVGTLALNGKFEELADAYVNIGQPKRNRAELIAEFKRRLIPVCLSQISKEKKNE
jgi:fatty acid desaturase